jgi:hypothetical protein
MIVSSEAFIALCALWAAANASRRVKRTNKNVKPTSICICCNSSVGSVNLFLLFISFGGFL